MSTLTDLACTKESPYLHKYKHGYFYRLIYVVEASFLHKLIHSLVFNTHLLKWSSKYCKLLVQTNGKSTLVYKIY